MAAEGHRGNVADRYQIGLTLLHSLCLLIRKVRQNQVLDQFLNSRILLSRSYS